MLRFLLWIVYKAVVIELSEQDPSWMCILQRVSTCSMDLCNILVEVTLRKLEVLGDAFRVCHEWYSDIGSDCKYPR